MRVGVVLGVMMLAGCAAGEARPQGEPPAPPAERIAFEVKSWGVLQASWTLEPSGEATFTSMKKTGPEFRDVTPETRSFDIGAEGYAEIASLVAPARAAVAKPPECKTRITDAPYGNVAWAGGAQLKFDYGCMSKQWDVVYRGLHDAREKMAEWAKAGTLVATPN